VKLAIANLSELPYATRIAMEDMEVQVGQGWGVEHDGAGHHTDISADSLEVSGDADVNGFRHGGPELIRRTAVMSTSLTASVNDWDPIQQQVGDFADALYVRVTSDNAAGWNISGFVAPAGLGDDLRRFHLANVGVNIIYILHASGLSVSTNRVACPQATTFDLHQSMGVWLWYDSLTGNWRIEGNR
jgi:hypothetical protein